jgi:tetratricopeptide (TPR) repeat protein
LTNLKIYLFLSLLGCGILIYLVEDDSKKQLYYSHQKLDKYYISEGDIQYKKGLLSDAELTYLRGLEIDPDNDDLHTSLGTIYESLGDLKQAIKHYKISSNSGEVRGINNLGRALVSQSSSGSAIQAEAFLLMAFQYAELKAKTDESESLHILRYQLNRNLGWATLKQKKYSVAEYFLKKAIYLDESLQEVQEGGGMAYCFLANLHEQQGHYEAANKNWMQCLRKAHPETLGEYQWLLEVKKDMYASCIDTSFVITIEARTKLKDHALDKLGRCNRLYKKLQHDAQIYADSNTKNE